MNGVLRFVVMGLFNDVNRVFAAIVTSSFSFSVNFAFVNPFFPVLNAFITNFPPSLITLQM